MLDAALNHLVVHGRIVLCGLIEQYNSNGQASGPRNLSQVIRKRILMQGLLVSDHWQHYGGVPGRGHAGLRGGHPPGRGDRQRGVGQHVASLYRTVPGPQYRQDAGQTALIRGISHLFNR